MKPIVYNSALQLPKNTKIVSAFKSALTELFYTRNPKFKKGQKNTSEHLNKFFKKNKIKPVWLYYQSLNTAVQTLPEKEFFELRTARNKNIIQKKEQLAFRGLKIGVAGLSVGSSIVSAVVLSGGSKNIKIADFDNLELTNLNRIQANILNLGQDKCQIAAEKVWAQDPYANLELYSKGLDEQNLEKFLLKPKLSVFIDEMDSIHLKILARQICKKHKIPVLMATDNGDGIILDVERFDQDPKLKIFQGRLENIDLSDLKNLPFPKWLELANKIVGINLLSNRMKESISQIGKKITSVSQLGTSATVAGSVISLALRKIATKQKLNSGRYTYDLEQVFYAKRT